MPRFIQFPSGSLIDIEKVTGLAVREDGTWALLGVSQVPFPVKNEYVEWVRLRLLKGATPEAVGE